MRIRQFLARRASLALLAVAFVALLGLAGGAFWIVDANRRLAEQVEQTQQVRGAANRLYALVQAAESSQRGYLLTQEEAYLAPYENAIRQYGAALDLLTNGLPAERFGLNDGELRRFIEDKMSEVQQTVAMNRSGDRAGALALVDTARGRNAMDGIRRITQSLIISVDSALKDGFRKLDWQGRLLVAASILLVLVILAVAAVSLRMLLGHTKALEATQAELERANQGLETRVRERTADLEAANEEIQRFAYIVSHDLRSPLVNIMGFTSEFESGIVTLKAQNDRLAANHPELLSPDAVLTVDEDMPEAVGFIRSSTQRMDRLINAILKLSREGRRTLTVEAIDSGALFDNLVRSLVHPTAESNATITLIPQLPPIATDRLSMEQVFGNLLDNAVKYLDPARPGRILVRGKRIPGRRVVFEVEDNGRGIDPRDHERIFELFRRSGVQDRPGEGIGLAHVRALVRRLGGTITCESTAGKGAIFRVTLPETLMLSAEEKNS